MKTISWKVCLEASPSEVFSLLSTDEGRKSFWAEKAQEKDGAIHFEFPNGWSYSGKILKSIPDQEFHLDYFESLVRFQLEPNAEGGTDLLLINEGVPDHDYLEVYAGWVSVLMNLKAVVDHHADLRNHNSEKTWDQGYVNN